MVWRIRMISASRDKQGKRRARELQPLARLAPLGIEPGDQAPEALRMVELGEVRHLVSDDVIDQRGIEVHQTPAQPDRAVLAAEPHWRRALDSATRGAGRSSRPA